MSERSPNIAGAACGLGAAALFGASAPFAKLLLDWTGPLLLSALLSESREARLQRSDLWPLAGMVTLGAMFGPLLMPLGLQRISFPAACTRLDLGLEHRS